MATENRLQFLKKSVPQKKRQIIRNGFSESYYNIIYLVSTALNLFILEKCLQWKYSLICFWCFYTVNVTVLSHCLLFKD